MDIRALREKAERGDLIAATVLGIYLLEGTGVEKDVASAFDLLSKAAAEGVSRARLHLGRMYLRGIGCEQDTQRGLKLCERAAEAGEFQALIELARHWKEPDPKKAAKFYQRAVDLDIQSCPEMKEAREFVKRQA